jgi:glutathione S-transferase
LSEREFQEKLYHEVFLPAVEKYFPIYESKLRGSSSGFVAPSGITYVDFFLAEFFTTIHNLHPEVLARYPSVEKHRQRVHSDPRVKRYVEGRKQSPI